METQTSLILMLVSARGYINSISLHNLPRLRTSNVDRSNERKWFYAQKSKRRRYPAQTITDADYADDIALLANTPTQAKFLLHSLELAARGIGLHVDAEKTEYMCFNQKGDISILNGGSLKLLDNSNRKRGLIYWKLYQCATNKGMDCYL